MSHQTVEKMKVEIEQQKESYNKLTEEITDMKTDNENLNEIFTSTQTLANQDTESFTTALDEPSELMAETYDIEWYKSQLEQYKQAITDWESWSQTHLQETQTLQESLAHYTSAYNNIVEEQKNKCDDNNEIVSLKKTIDRLKTEKSELEHDLEVKNDHIETLEKKVKQKNREIKIYRNRLIENQKKANFQDSKMAVQASKSLNFVKNVDKKFVKSACSMFCRLLFKSHWLRFFILGLLFGLTYAMIIMYSIENLVYSLGFGSIGILDESWAKYYTEKFRHSVAVDPYFACKSRIFTFRGSKFT